MKIGIGIDYSNICHDYNTSYLDRDNTDPKTTKCMRQVLDWAKMFLSELTEHFGYNIYQLHAKNSVKIEDVASKRFLFYSLEKEITLQSYVLQETYIAYDSLATWEAGIQNSILIQNDKDGEGVYLFFDESSQMHQWITHKLKDFSLEEIPFLAK